MGFGHKWCEWIDSCVTAVSMSILNNGSPSAPFRMQRCLRQEDPLSPFLFVLITEVFSRMIHKAKVSGLIDVVNVGNEEVEVTHLQFADDTLIFAQQRRRILRIIGES